MKRIIILLGAILILLIISCSPACAQSLGKIIINESDLTPAQLTKFKAEQELEILNKKIEHYGKWVGVGNEVGLAMREGLMAVKDVAVEFSDEKVGKFTMMLIAWKVMGREVVKIITGIIIGLIMFFLIFFSYKKTCVRRKEVEIHPGFIKWFFGSPKTYSYIDPPYNGGDLVLAQVIHVAILLISVWIVYGIMFS